MAMAMGGGRDTGAGEALDGCAAGFSSNIAPSSWSVRNERRRAAMSRQVLVEQDLQDLRRLVVDMGDRMRLLESFFDEGCISDVQTVVQREVSACLRRAAGLAPLAPPGLPTTPWQRDTLAVRTRQTCARTLRAWRFAFIRCFLPPS